MNKGEITFPFEVQAFAPGDVINGTASWELTQQPRSGAVNLFWYVEQRKGPHIHLVKSAAIEAPALSGQLSFTFTAPEGPSSYNGKLFTIHWAIELLFEPDLVDVREKIIIAPGRMAQSIPSDGD